jgi:hypothetical protein
MVSASPAGEADRLGRLDGRLGQLVARHWPDGDHRVLQLVGQRPVGERAAEEVAAHRQHDPDRPRRRGLQQLHDEGAAGLIIRAAESVEFLPLIDE